MSSAQPGSSRSLQPAVVALALAAGLLACPGSNNPSQQPTIVSFTASKSTVAPGEQVTFTWQVQNATSLRIDPGIGEVTGRTQASASVTQTTEYTLKASNGANSATSSLTVTVEADVFGGAVSFQWSGVPASIAAGTPFTATLTAKDAGGNTATGYRGTVTFSSTDAIASLPPSYTFNEPDQGRHNFEVTLRTTNPSQQSITGRDTVQTTLAGTASVSLTNALVYTDPVPGGKIRLVKDGSSTPTTVVLKLISAQSLNGYAVGFDLPLAAGKVRANAALITAGDALDPGAAPQPFKASIPSTGPLANVLLSVLSQKAAGAGSVAGDAAVPAGKTFYTIKLDLQPGATPGTVFNGAALGPKFRAALMDKSGEDTARQSDFAIGKLELF